ncbi:MAG: MATE family efflux transporter [Deltaproteobacteria bacterium]|nr:MATE family efflux transporter [Deltaproteobacteria bacterium]
MDQEVLENTTQGRYPSDLLEGSITKNIIRLALPLVIAMLIQTGFSVVDMIFVGMVSPEAIASVSMVFPVMFFFIAIAMGIGVGLTSFIARSIGEGDLEKAARIASNGLAFSFFISSTLAVIGFIFSRQVFEMLGAAPVIIDSVVGYSRILFIGFLFLFFGAFCGSIIRGTGDTKTPMKFMITAILFNVVLDPIFIFGLGPVPALGIRGAALATVISRSIIGILAVRHFAMDRSIIQPIFKDFRFDLSLIKEILRVGVPSSITTMSASISLMLYMKLVSAYGPFAIAGFGIAGRIESIATLPAFGMSGAILAIVGQNIGAKNFDRARITVGRGVILISGFMLVVCIFAIIFAKQIFYIFTDELKVIAVSIDFIRYRGPFFVFMGVRMIISAGFNGAGNPKVGLFTVLFGPFVVGLPLAVILSGMMGLNGIWLGISAGSVGSAALAYLLYTLQFPRQNSTDSESKNKRA